MRLQRFHITHGHLPKISMFYASVSILLASVLLLGATIIIQARANRFETPAQPYVAGRLVRAGDVRLRVSDIHTESGNPPFVAGPGQQYLTFDLWVKNVSGTAINVLPSSDTYLKTPGGDTVYLTPYELKSPFRAGELAPGEQLHGQLSFLVRRTQSYKFIIDAKWSGSAVPVLVQKGAEK